MTITDAILHRRSIRKFLAKDIDKTIIEKIIEAGILAPSGKNRQPWKFVVISPEKKQEMITTLNDGIEKAEGGGGLLKNFANLTASAKHTVKIMEEAPVTIFIINTENKLSLNQTVEEKLLEMINIQSIGGAIENMILAALEYGIGSLWICDIYFSYAELSAWLKTDNQIIAALSLGYPGEHPPARPRKEKDTIVEWK